MVELSNGCICCTLREDLLSSLASLAAERRFDHVLVESSGISEPLPVAETFTFKDEHTGVKLSDIASLHNMVTVVDAASIFEQLNTLDQLADRGWQAGEKDERTVAQLLCDQLEFANLLLVNKADLVSEEQLGAVEAVCRKLNPKADVIKTTHSEIEPHLLFGEARFDMDTASAHPNWLVEARENEHTPETIEYGISSFIFRSRKPFHPERLHKKLGGGVEKFRVGALSKLLRVKGFAWIAPWTSRQAVVALAGTQLTVQPGEPWWASVKKEHWPVEMRQEIEEEWDDEHGDRKTSLVCIGQDLDHEAAQKELESCLLTDEEMAGGSKTWFGLKDPFFEQWEGEQRKDGRVRGEDHGKLAKVGTSAYVLVLHKDKKFSLQTAVSVLAQAGIGADVGLRLVTAVQKNGQGIVVQGKEDDCRLMAGMFKQVGMQTTVQPAPPPPAATS